MNKTKRIVDRSQDRLAPGKQRIGIVISRKLVERLKEAAEDQNVSMSALIVRIIKDGLEETEEFHKFFSDKEVRRMFVDMIKKPGSMKTISDAAGITHDLDKLQTTIFEKFMDIAKPDIEKEQIKA